MSDQKLFRVVFQGALTGEFDLPRTKRRFARLFRLEKSIVEKLFSGREHVLRDSVSEDAAVQFAIKVAKTGCECYIEPVPAASDLAQRPGFVERRKGERRLRFRRPPRPGAIIPDRRTNPGRRKEDQDDRGRLAG